jgi:hypothetical protein
LEARTGVTCFNTPEASVGVFFLEGEGREKRGRQISSVSCRKQMVFCGCVCECVCIYMCHKEEDYTVAKLKESWHNLDEKKCRLLHQAVSEENEELCPSQQSEGTTE